jgi:DNA (cytosine-5)-methyltransferase 1
VTRLGPLDFVSNAPTALEFFAGIGLVRLGLESAGFRVAWANDIKPAKRDMYAGHFGAQAGAEEFTLGDIADLSGGDMPSGVSLAWASFPCIDLSLAGWRRGLGGSCSSVFWQFTRILDEMEEDRPPVVTLENVIGFATSHQGHDLTAAIWELNRLGYSVDVLTLDARRFVPQSRPRLFIVGAQDPPASLFVPDDPLRPDWLRAPYADPALVTHCAALPAPPAPLADGMSSLMEDTGPDDERWWDQGRTAAFVSSLSPIQAQRLEALRKGREFAYRAAYRRTRSGKPVWEMRRDDISGCLRTARGGSSKQALVQAGRGHVRVRWMTPREYARLMGAPGYTLDGLRRNQALFGFGDAVCVPVVEWLAEHYLLPLATGELREEAGEAVAIASA